MDNASQRNVLLYGWLASCLYWQRNGPLSSRIDRLPLVTLRFALGESLLFHILAVHAKHMLIRHTPSAALVLLSSTQVVLHLSFSRLCSSDCN